MVDCYFPGTVSNANRAGVPHPAAIGGRDAEIHRSKVGTRFLQDGTPPRLRLAILNQQEDALDSRELPNNFREGPGNRCEFSWPIRWFVLSTEPRCRMRFPFGRHAKTQSIRGG